MSRLRTCYASVVRVLRGMSAEYRSGLIANDIIASTTKTDLNAATQQPRA